MLDTFKDDTTIVSVNYLLALVYQRDWNVKHLYKVVRYHSDAHHFVTILDNGHLICDCMMLTNLGIPCRHIFSLFVHTNIAFHLSMINAR
jgi:hypothetical protein